MGKANDMKHLITGLKYSGIQMVLVLANALWSDYQNGNQVMTSKLT